MLSSQDALFVECKLVGKAHPVGSFYCNKGISRFVDGDYGWAMQEGMMLGYVRHGYTLLGKLRPILSDAVYHEGAWTAKGDEGRSWWWDSSTGRGIAGYITQ